MPPTLKTRSYFFGSCMMTYPLPFEFGKSSLRPNSYSHEGLAPRKHEEVPEETLAEMQFVPEVDAD